MKRWRRAIATGAIVCAALALSLIVGTACHEVVGHGLVGALCGGTIEYVDMLGVEFYPEFRWIGWPAGLYFGHCNVAGLPSKLAEDLMSLGGSLSTWCVAVAATCVLCLGKRRGWPAAVLAALSLWWIDALSYTLPGWGLRKAVFWGSKYPEPYVAATTLGCPGWLFQAIVISGSLLMAASVLTRLTCVRRREGELRANHGQDGY